MADEHTAEVLSELRRIRLALNLLVLVGCALCFMLAMSLWAESTRSPGGDWQQLQSMQNLQGELRGIREELSRQRNPAALPPLPPLAIPGGKAGAGQK